MLRNNMSSRKEEKRRFTYGMSWAWEWWHRTGLQQRL